MATKEFCSLKKGNWFVMWGMIFKIYEAGMFTILAHHMIRTDDDYVEGDAYAFDAGLVMFNAKEYKPHEEEFSGSDYMV